MNTHRSLSPLFLCLALGALAQGCAKKDAADAPAPSALDLTGARQGQAVGFFDVDGDGFADKAVGAPYAAPASSGTGALLLYQGSATGFSGSPTLVLRGDDNLGYALVTVGEDLAVGALHGSGEDVSLSGSVTIFQGGGSGAIVRKLSGEWPLDKFGLALASGDLNGDAVPDLVVGAPFNTNDPARYQGGAVYVFLGPDYGTRVALHASAANGGLGWAVAAGDVSGDGTDDLVISAAGKVLVFNGAVAFSPSIDAPSFTFTSAAAGFGRALAVLGDVDGVPGSELAIGAPNAVLSLNTLTSRDAGSVFVVKVAGAPPVGLDGAIAGPTGPLLARLDGETLFSRFGASLAPSATSTAAGSRTSRWARRRRTWTGSSSAARSSSSRARRSPLAPPGAPSLRSRAR